MLRTNRSFAKMFFAYALSAFGDYFDFMAICLLMAYVWKADAMTVALLPVSFAVPGILLGQLAGIGADRWNRRNAMIAADLLRAGITAGMIFAPNAWVLIGLAALRSAARAFHYPAQQAMTRGVVGAERLLQAASLNGAAFQLSKVLGPLLGASAAAAFSPAGCMAVNAASFVVSALLLLRIPAEQGNAAAAPSSSERKPPLRAAWRGGWTTLLQRRVLLASLIFNLIGLAGIQLIDAQITVLLRDAAPGRPELIGWIISAIGAGGLAGVAWLRRYRQLTGYGRLLGGGLALIGLMFVCFGMFRQDTPLWFLLLASGLGGLGTGFTSTGMTYILQKETPPEAVGRVSGILDSLSGVVFMIAPLVGGALIGLWGAAHTFLAVGMAVGALGLLGVALRRVLWKTSALASARLSPPDRRRSGEAADRAEDRPRWEA